MPPFLDLASGKVKGIEKDRDSEKSREETNHVHLHWPDFVSMMTFSPNANELNILNHMSLSDLIAP